jgi:hypothetical protein
MSANGDSRELRSILDPVWFNTYWVKNALNLYEGVSTHAEEITGARHNHFFGLVQKISLEYAILVICKIFDKTNRHYEKDTIYALLTYLENNIIGTYVVRLKVDVLMRLGISEEKSNIFLHTLRHDFAETKAEFLDAIKVWGIITFA